MSIAVTQSRPLDAIAQIQQFCFSLGLLINTLCESTNSAFRRVHVMKKDEQNNIKLYDVKDKTTGEIKKVAVRSYIEDIKTGNLQWDEPRYIVATKCALLALGMPFYTFGRIAWHLFKTPLEISALVIDILKKVGEQLMMERLYEASIEVGNGLSRIVDVTGYHFFEMIKAPFFGLGAWLAAISGVFKPYHGRRSEALIENAWQEGASYKDDFRNVPARAGENCCEAFAKDLHDTHPFYAGHCFQVRGNVNDPHYVVIRREAI